MGLSSLPAPSEGGVLCLLLANAALSISIVKGTVRSVLDRFVAIHSESSSSDTTEEYPSESLELHSNPASGYIGEFQSRFPAIRFDTVCRCKQPEHDCSVCLTPFELESEINRLSCGHFFHKACLEKWLGYWNTTCPLCRLCLMGEEVTSSSLWKASILLLMSTFHVFACKKERIAIECVRQGRICRILQLHAMIEAWCIIDKIGPWWDPKF